MIKYETTLEEVKQMWNENYKTEVLQESYKLWKAGIMPDFMHCLNSRDYETLLFLDQSDTDIYFDDPDSSYGDEFAWFSADHAFKMLPKIVSESSIHETYSLSMSEFVDIRYNAPEIPNSDVQECAAIMESGKDQLHLVVLKTLNAVIAKFGIEKIDKKWFR